MCGTVKIILHLKYVIQHCLAPRFFGPPSQDEIKILDDEIFGSLQILKKYGKRTKRIIMFIMFDLWILKHQGFL